MHPDQKASIQVFYSYSHTDDLLRLELEKHLSTLKRQGKIVGWNDRMIEAGSDWDNEIDLNMRSSNVILLLVSSDFIASDYCYGKELQAAIDKKKSGTAIVIPIILRACDWKSTILAGLQALPKDGKPVTSWSNRDEAWTDVATGIRAAINQTAFHIAMEQSALFDGGTDRGIRPPKDDVRPLSAPSVLGIKDCLIKAVDKIDELFSKDETISGMATSFKDLDYVLGGINSGELIVVSGRTGVGKTAFVANIVETNAIKETGSVLVFSLEMDDERFVTRMMASLGHVEHQRMRNGRLDEDDWPRLTSSVSLLAEAKVMIGKGQSFSIDSISKLTIEAAGKGGLNLVVIDGLHLISDALDGREHIYSAVARRMKSLAVELDIPIIVTLPIGFECDNRPNKRPVPRDLFRYGDLEQVADVVMFIYRDEMYYSDSPDVGAAELIIAKNRQGQIGTVMLTFVGKYFRFENLEETNLTPK